MKYKSTLVLFVLVVVAGIVAFSLSRKPTSEELEQQRSRLLPGLSADDVETLVVEEGDERIVCQRDADDPEEWRITEPVDIRADRYAVEEVIRKLELADRQARAALEGLDPADYGLEDPVRTVTLRGEGPASEEWVVTVGDDAPAGGTVWVGVSGAPAVYSVERDVTDETAVSVAGLRSKNLGKRISRWNLEKLSVAAAAAGDEAAYELTCEKADGTWEIKQPFYELADESAIEAIANKIYDHNVKAEDVVVDDADQAAQYGLDPPALTVTVTGRDRTDTFLLSRRTEDEETVYYAMQRGENSIVQVPESLFDALRKKPAELRETTLANFRVDDVHEVRVTMPGGELLLAREEDEWQIAGDEPTAADAETIKSFLEDLKEADVEEFVADQAEDPTPYGLGEGQRRDMVLADEDGETLARLAFGAAAEGDARIYARRGEYPAVLAIEREPYLDKLERGRLAFLDRTVLDETRADMAELRLVRGTEKFLCTWNDERARWDLIEPVSGEADTPACQMIVGDFANLEAAAFAAEDAEDLATYGLDEPTVTCTATFRAEATEDEPAPEERVYTLQIGDDTSEPAEGRYARLEGDDRVFVLARSKVRHFEENLASKQIARAWNLRKVTFSRGGAELTLSYDAEDDVWRDTEGNEVAEDLADRMREARYVLGSFKGERIADYVMKAPALYGFDEPYLAIEIDEEQAKGKSILIGNEVDGGGRYAKGPASGFVQVAADEDVAKLLAVIEPPAEVEADAEAAPPPAEPAE